MKRIFTLFASLFFISWLSQAQPSTQVSGITFEPIPTSTTSIKINWTIGNGTGRIVVLKDATGVFTPVNGTNTNTLGANADFSAATDLDGGAGVAKVVAIFTAAEATVTVSNLTANTLYNIQVYEFATSAANPTYSFVTSATNPRGFTFFTTSGTFNVPNDVTNVRVQALGGGGGGGGADSNSGENRAGGGAAGGSYTLNPSAAVSGGAAITVTVGGGGTKGEGGNDATTIGTGGTGGTSNFGGLVTAVGGAGGSPGLAANETGAGAGTTTGTTFNGGAGTEAPPTGGDGTDATASGAGGGGAGITASGSAAVTTTGGAGGVGGGGTGANGRSGLASGTFGAGFDATQFGGGGGGGWDNLDNLNDNSDGVGTDPADADGGAGAAGYVLVSFNDNTVPVVSSIARLTPATSPTTTPTGIVIFRVTFNENVSNVNAADFTVTGPGTPVIGTVTANSGVQYDVQITGISTTLSGTVDLSFGSHNIVDISNNAFGGSITSEQTYTVDNTGPVLTLATASPTTGTAKIGDVVTLTVTADATGLVAGTSTINGSAFSGTFTDIGGNAYTLTYTVGSGHANWAAGALPFSIRLNDALGNQSNAITAFTTANTLAGDANAPTFTSVLPNPNTGTAKIGDAIQINFTATGAEATLVDGTSLTVNGVNVKPSFTNLTGGNYQVTYTVGSGNTDRAAGALPLSLQINDAAGNTATINAFTAVNTLAIDANAPTNQNTIFPTSTSKIGGGSVTIVAGTATDFNWFAPSGTTVFVANGTTITTAAGNATSIVAPTVVGSYQLFVLDAVGNYSAASTATLTVDNTAPVLSLATASPTTGTAKIGDVVTITVTAGETGLVAGTSSINLQAFSGTFTDIGGNAYTLTYTVGSGHANWAAGALPFSIILNDVAGNPSNAIIAFTTANTLAGDANAPTFSSVLPSPSTGIAKIGDAVQVNFTAVGLEANLVAGSTLTVNGVNVSGSFTNLTGGNYRVTYTVASGNTDRAAGALPLSLQVNDAAGNTATINAFTAVNTLAIDANAPTNQNTIFPTSTSKIGGGSVTIVAGTTTDFNWLAPSGTTVFVANGTTITTAAGNATSIVAPTVVGSYQLFVLDAVGNYSAASTATLTVENTPPTAAITYSDADGYIRSGQSLTITATFNEPIADAPVMRIALSGANTVAATVMTKSTSTVYTYVHTGAAGNGTVTVALSIGTDVGGNVITAAPTSGATFIVDNLAPSAVTINQAVGQLDPSYSPVNYTVVFTNGPIDPATLTSGDFIVSGGTLDDYTIGSITTLDNISFNVVATITPGTEVNGTIIPTLFAASQTVTDLAGNVSATLTATVPTDNTVEAILEPTTSPSISVTTGPTQNTLTLTRTGGNGERYLLVAREGAAVNFTPVDGTDFSAIDNLNFFSAIAQDGNGNKVLDDDNSGTTTYNVTGLAGGTTYHFAMFPFNQGSTSALNNYRTTAGTTSATTTACSYPTAPVTGVHTSNTTSITLNWVRTADTDFSLVLVRADDGSIITAPVNGANFGNIDNAAFGTAGTYGNAKVVLADESHATNLTQTRTITGLTPGTTYAFAIYTYNATTFCYQTTHLSGTRTTTTTTAAELTVTSGPLTEPNTISSIGTALVGAILPQTNAVANFDFTVTDADGNNAGDDLDGADGIISQIIIYQGSNNSATLADWSQAIASAQLSDGTTTQTLNITINPTNITIASINTGTLGLVLNDRSKTYTLTVALKTALGGSLPATIDGKQFDFNVTTNVTSSFTTSGAGSSFPTGQSVSSGLNKNMVDVTATKIDLTTPPSTSAVATVALATQPVYTARDFNNNTDLSFGNAITAVTTSNVDNLSPSGQPTNFTAGVATFSGFKFNNVGTSTMTITANSIVSQASAAITVTSTTTLGGSTATMAASPLTNSTVGVINTGDGSSTNAVLRFSLQTSGSNLNLTSLTFTSSPAITGLVKNFKLYSDVDDTFIGSTLEASSTSLTFSSLTVPLSSTAKYFYLTCDVEPYFPTSTPTIQFSIPNTNFTVSIGGTAGTTQTGTNYSLQDLTPPTFVSILRQSAINPWSTTGGTSATSVIFRLTFSENVTGIEYSGVNNNTTYVNYNAVPSSFSGNANTASNFVDITLGGITGEGPFSLRFIENDNVFDLAGNPINGPGFSDFYWNTPGNEYYTKVIPEPTSDISALNVTAIDNTSVSLQWNSPGAGQNPTHFLVMAKPTSGSYPSVADGGYVADGALAKNIVRSGGGSYTTTFSGLSSGVNYDFIIYPYTLYSAGNPGSITNDNIDYKTTVPATTLGAYPSGVPLATALASTMQFNSSGVLVSSILNDNTPGVNVLQFRVFDDGQDPISPNLMTLKLNGFSQETITFTLREALTLGNGASVTGFTSSNGSIASAIYTTAGNTITLTNVTNGTWSGSTTISYSATGNVDFLTLGKMQAIVSHAVFLTTETVVTFSSSGTFVVPAGVTSIQVEAWGAGGSGGGFNNNSTFGSSDGGGGGAYSRSLMTVTPSSSYNYTIGTGGTPVAPSPWTGSFGINGLTTSFVGPTTVLAEGGWGGMPSFPNACCGPFYNQFGGWDPNNSRGGLASNGIGDFKLSGGSGGFGYIDNGTPSVGGGGGSSAGTTLNGNIGVNGFNCFGCLSGGGANPGGGGAGGSGAQSGGGGTGIAPGGGGGGVGASFVSGAGANGQIRITYSSPGGSATSDLAADNAPFKFNQIVITQQAGAANSDPIDTWTQVIAGAELTTGATTLVGTVGANTITFGSGGTIASMNTGDFGYIDDAVSAPSYKDYTLKIWLLNPLSNALAAQVDNLILGFAVSPGGFTLSNSNSQASSRFLATHSTLNSSNAIDVDASILKFQTAGSSSPTDTNPQGSIGVGTPFSASSAQDPEVYALDANNNLDVDYTNANGNSGAISPSGHSTNSLPFLNGKLSLNPFYFTTAGVNTQIVIAGVGSPTVSSATSTNVTAVVTNKTTISDATPPGSELASFTSITTALPASHNFDFTVTDDVGVDAVNFTDNDALPTLIQTVTITQDANNGINSGGDVATFDNWTLSIAGAQLTDGTSSVTITNPSLNITGSTLVFNVAGTSMETIANNGSKTYQLRIWLKNPVDASLLDILDNKDFAFAINQGNVSLGAANTTSVMAPSSSTSTADGRNVVTVTASQLDFTTQWATNASQSYDAAISPSPVAKARDTNQNLDTDWSTGNGKVGAVVTAAPVTYPLANSAVALTNGVFTFDPALQVTSAGGGTNGAITNLVLSSIGLSNGTSNSFTLNYSGASDIARENTDFVYPTDILYAAAANQVTDIGAATGVAMERFRIRDGGGSVDTDGTSTKMSTVTIRVTNYQYLRRIALYENGTSPGYALNNELAELPSTAATNIVGNTADFVFTGITAFEATDGGTRENNFLVKVSFVSTQFTGTNNIDNKVLTFEVVAVAAGGVSSSFANPAPTGTVSSISADQNKIEVVADRLDITTPAAASFVSINTNFVPVVQARDANANVDLDFTGVGSGAITALTNWATATMTSTPAVVGRNFTNGVFTFPSNFKFTTGNNDAIVTLTMDAGGISTSPSGISPILTLKTNTLKEGILIEPTSVSSLGTAAPGVSVFDFMVNDDDNQVSGTDSSPTRISDIVITKLAGQNDIGDWRDLIAVGGATLQDNFGNPAIVGTVNQDDITFTGINSTGTSATAIGVINDNTSKIYTLRITLKSALGGSLPATVDNLNIAFEVLGANITPAASGTNNFGGTESEHSNPLALPAGTNNIDVVATKLKWTTNPTGGSPAGSLLVNKDISLQLPIPVIESLDIYNNRDLNYTTSLNISNTGILQMSGSAQSGVTTFSLVADGSAPLTGGLYTFPNNFQFDAIGNGTMTAAPNGITSVVTTSERVSTPVTVRVGSASTITASATLAEPSIISSIADNDNVASPVSGGTDVFDFTINDDPAGTPATENDGNPTRIQRISITQSAGNTITNWADAIAAAQLSDTDGNSGFGTITSNSIDFGAGSGLPNAVLGDPGYIVDDGSKTYTLKIWLKEALGGNLPTTIDALRFAFEVTGAASNIITDANGTSIIGSEDENSGPANNNVTVIATRIDYSQLDGTDNFISPYSTANFPVNGSINTQFSPRLGVEAHDVNSNRDLGFAGNITAFSANGLAYINGPNLITPDAFTAGTYKLPANFQYTSGNNQNGKLTMDAGGIIANNVSPDIFIISSFESWIYPTYPLQNIDYVNHQTTNIDLQNGNGYVIEQLNLSDGDADGITGDADGAATLLTSLTLGITNPQSIRRIALYTYNTGTSTWTEVAEQAGSSITVASGYGQITFSGLSLSAPDNSTLPIYVAVTFNNTLSTIIDNSIIQVNVTGAVSGSGSRLRGDSGDPSPGTFIGGVSLTSAPAQPVDAGAIGSDNTIEVTATKFDFTTQPGIFAGINEPVTTGIVSARDQFNLLDLDFNSTVDLSAPIAGLSFNAASFSLGILNLTGLEYTSAGNGTITVDYGSGAITSVMTGLSGGLANISVQCNTIDVIHVTATENTNGVVSSNNIKGGTSNVVIFGVTFDALHYTVSHPELKGFSFIFDQPYKNSTTSIFKNFRIFESTNGNYAGSLNVTAIPGTTVTESQSQLLASANPAPPTTSLDLVTVTFPTGSYRTLNDPSNPLTYYLVVDVDATANIGTPKITPQLIDGGFGSLTNSNILLTQGSSAANVVGKQYSFASTRPPTLISSYPANGQLNVDPAQNTISLTFDVGVWSLDGEARLYDRKNNKLIATLTAINGLYTGPGSPVAGSAINPTPLTFQIPTGVSLKPDSVYYVTIEKGTFDTQTDTGTGISDDGLNLFGGISYNGTLYFKIASPYPPVLKTTEPLKYYISETGGAINASFDQFGTAYFLVVNPGDPVPTNAQIKTGVTGYIGTEIARGTIDINQIYPNTQFGTFTANLNPGSNYAVWIYAENDALPSPFATSAPFGSAANSFAVGSGTSASPTLKITVPSSSGTLYLNEPRYQICSNSVATLADPIIIAEGNMAEFNFGVQNFNLLLPTGFAFNTNSQPTITLSGSDFVPGQLSYSFFNNTILNISFNNNNSASLDNIVISNLQVTANSSDISGVIRRFAGNAIPSIVDGQRLASIVSSAAAAPSFNNTYTTNNNFAAAPIFINNVVTSIPDNFVDPQLPESTVRLLPIIPVGDYGPSFFSGSGVTNDILNLTGVPLNSAFDITMLHTDMNGCISTKSEQYTVYDHTKAIPILGTKSCSVNSNFPGISPSILSADKVDKFALAGYSLIRLTASIPAKADAFDPLNLGANTDNSQIIFGPEWQKLVKKIPVKFDSIMQSNGTFRSYKWEYSYLLNANSLSSGILKDPYEFFKEITPQGNDYYQGGSIGIVEFTGKYQSNADNTVQIPLRQEVEIFVPAKPVVEVSGQSSNTGATPIFCEKNTTDILMSGYPAASAGASKGFFVLRDSVSNSVIYDAAANIKPSGFIDNTNGTANLTPSILFNVNKTIRVDYTYQEDNSPCSSTGTLYIRISPNPIAKFALESDVTASVSGLGLSAGMASSKSAYCTLIPINFDPATSSIATDKIATYFWEFGDINSATNLDTTKIANAKTINVYPSIGTYRVKLIATSDKGCGSVNTDNYLDVTVGSIPTVNFDLLGISTADQITFTDKSTALSNTSNSFSKIQTASWNYGDGTTNSSGIHQYTTPGHYNATATITTAIGSTLTTVTSPGCSRSFDRHILILDKKIGAYGDDFETVTKSWQTIKDSLDGNGLLLTASSQQPSSWKRGTPLSSRAFINSTPNTGTINNNVWATGLTAKFLSNERSFLYSPAVNLTGFVRPMISFDTNWDLGKDGVVLEYSVDSKNVADPTKKWETIGNNTTGVNWFNEQLIGSKPGNNPSGFGWTGASDKNKWVESKHELSKAIDPTASRANVVFRFAFATINPGGEGIAFDNFRIGERTRTILLENFVTTNSGNATKNTLIKSENEAITLFNSSVVISGSSAVNVVNLNYHIGFTGSDPFNLDNPADPSARALYYNVKDVPWAFLDGIHSGADIDPKFSTWGLSAYNTQTLQLGQAEIIISTPSVNLDGSIKFDIQVKALYDLPDNTVLHVALIEKSVLASALLQPQKDQIKTGESTFDYVLKKMLPNASGTKFGTALARNQSRAFPGYEYYPDASKLYLNKDDLAIIVFLQNDSDTDKRIFQTEMINVNDPPVVTGLENAELLEHLEVYPNPADKEFIIQLPGVAKQSMEFQLVDQVGKVVNKDLIGEGTSRKTINTQDLAAGIYILQIGSGKSGVVRKKVLVVHQQ